MWITVSDASAVPNPVLRRLNDFHLESLRNYRQLDDDGKAAGRVRKCAENGIA
jgi:hypothetical protein